MRLPPLLDSAIRHGDIAALGAGMLEYGIGIDVPRDPLRAYTYVQVAMRIEQGRGHDASGLGAQAARLAAELTPPQREIGDAAAQRLFQDAGWGAEPAQ
jgi:hypothetical protein